MTPVPEPTPEQVEKFRENLANGVYGGHIIVLKPSGLVLQGNHRYRVCQENGIPVPVLEVYP